MPTASARAAGIHRAVGVIAAVGTRGVEHGLCWGRSFETVDVLEYSHDGFNCAVVVPLKSKTAPVCK